MGTKVNSNYEDLITFTRASKGHALRPVSYGDELVSSSDQNQTATATDIIAGVEVDPISVEIGKIYFVSATVTATSTGTFINPDWGVGEPNIDPNQAVSFDLLNEQDAYEDNVETNVYGTVIPTQSTIGVAFRVGGASSGNNTITVSNISVKEVLFDQPDGTLTLFEHPNNVPRVEWDADRNRLGLLVEEARTNLVTDSQDFSGWTNVNAPLTPNAVEAPDGTITATKLVANATNGQHRIDFLSTYSAGTYTFSVFAKAGEYNFLELRLAGDGVYVDIRDGSVAGTSAGITTHYQDVGNGWKKIAITHSAGANDTARINVIETSGVRSFAGDGTSGIYIWGAQLEAGSFPTSYMKNEGTSSGVTRSADVASIPVADFGYNTKVGSVVAEYFPVKVDATIRSVFELAKDNNDRLYSAAANLKHWFAKNNNVVSANIDLGASTEDQSNKIAGVYKLNDFAASLDGGSVTTDTSGLVQTGITDLHIGGVKNSASNYLCGHIKSIKYYPRRLTNAQLQDLTS